MQSAQTHAHAHVRTCICEMANTANELCVCAPPIWSLRTFKRCVYWDVAWGFISLWQFFGHVPDGDCHEIVLPGSVLAEQCIAHTVQKTASLDQ